MKFCMVIPNVSTIFTGLPLIQRLLEARKCGFNEVEIQFPYEAGSTSDWQEAVTNAQVNVVLLNMYPGDLKAGELGCAAHFDSVDKFRADLDVSIDYCKAMNCKRLHIVSGKKRDGDQESKMFDTLVSNLCWAVPRLAEMGIQAVIEPINNKSVPRYFLNHPDLALAIIEKVRHPNLKIQFDFFHFQLITGNLTSQFKNLFPHIGHIQIAQVPNRDEPDELGEINYAYIFELLRECGYRGHVGAEYNQKKPTDTTFSWVDKYGNIKA